ncbi:MAG: CYTH domain-containing protein [Alistipes sp.]|nr:CYTH domain-containing protein [Alistipes sp.]
MAKEIERKFLVCGDFMSDVTSSTTIEQGYIARGESLTVRVRVRDERGTLTIKGRTNSEGTTRDEWEYEIPAAEARELLTHSKGTIKKVRHLAPMADGHTFEIDCFYGDNEGLTMAEIELSSADEEFIRPEWLGKEVTGDIRYYNSQLLKHPFSRWGEE